jgi:pilus assembly protein CpaC
MLKVAMPEALVTATPMNGMVILTGTVLTPDDVAEATRLTQEFVGEKVRVLTKIRTATPLQVNLRVKIAEVSRSAVREIGVNLLSIDGTGGFQFGLGQNGAAITQFVPKGPLGVGVTDGPETSTLVPGKAIGSVLGLAGNVFGLDLLGSLDLAETRGLATTLAEPNLTALSGETASFLAGGEIPIPQSAGLGAVSVEFKQYGVSLAFTPVVLSDGRISLRVRPEVSQLSDSGSVRLNGFVIPALTTRRAETTVELGSGQSFMIGGLIQNSHGNTTTKAPFLGDLPILGALFRSNAFKKEETELVIVVTPYLVRPTDAKNIRLPTEGYKAAIDGERFLTGRAVAVDAGTGTGTK